MSLKEKFLNRIDGLVGFLHILVLVLSLVLIGAITLDTFRYSLPFYKQVRYLEVQWWVCLALIAIFLIEWFLSKDRRHYFFKHLIFLLVAIPYLNVLPYMGWHLSDNTMYLLSFIPLIRAGYALAIMVGWFTYDHAAKLFVTYLLIAIAAVYFSSLVFYVHEVNINPLVHRYTDALWWACMTATTVGCSIEAVTPTGKVLSVIVAAMGVTFLPIFTVYITSVVGILNTKEKQRKQQIDQCKTESGSQV